ncbi:DNA polymerase III subunit gamma/tau [Patescibacteria group bacterium]|nr:DNA polymerase III subunit gamma/tau [Patescibacteria group bacterium]MBP9710298.1 DNA polymerase III subunit gamma/tau [Patescibacteria group bacterium]
MPSLSQTHRPRRFAEVTGQAHVTETLRREVATGLLAHAYVFSGPRGVGKTTSARIFAQALNCQAPKEGEPCGACPPCLAFAEGKLLDVIELDAATHTGVDTIREAIIEHVRFAPTFGKAKVYILDEAHMLSTSSWNALLKTLEEPPSYAYFILATTEWHKIPATIISRCQRFEFKRISDEVLAERVQSLAEQEQWKVDPEVVRLIVSRADGCVRDAETLLGQLGSLGESHIDVGVAGLVIPPTHVPLAAGLMGHWAARDLGASLQEARRLMEEGIAILPLFEDLLLITRQVLLAGALPDRARGWGEGTSEERAMWPLVGKFSAPELHDMALMLMERRKDVKSGIDPLFALELASTMIVCSKVSSIENRESSMGKGEREVNHQNATSSAGSKAKAEESSIVRDPVVVDPRVDPKTDVIVKDGSAPSIDPVQRVSEPMNQVVEQVSTSESSVSSSEDVIDLPTVRMKWSAIIRAIDEKNHSLPFILKISQPHEVQGKTLVIRFQYAFHRDKIITDIKNCRIVEECARAVLETPTLVVEGIVGEDVARAEERSSDMVSNILKAFGGQVVEG